MYTPLPACLCHLPFISRVIFLASGSVIVVPHFKIFPSLTGVMSVKVAEDVSGFFDSKRTTKSLNMYSSGTLLVEVYSLTSVSLWLSIVHTRPEVDIHFKFKLLLIQTSKDPLAGSSVISSTRNAIHVRLLQIALYLEQKVYLFLRCSCRIKHRL